MFIGITGKAGSGKDTVAKRIADTRRFAHEKFAYGVTDLAWEINPIVSASPTARYRDVMKAVGYERAKREYPEVRRFLQALGAGARDVIGRSVWVDLVKQGTWVFLDTVVSDVRFQNEANFIRENDGVMMRVVRPGSEEGSGSGHISETEMDVLAVDAVIVNDGTLEELYVKVDKVMGDIMAGEVAR